jgi:hypothetical protein
METSTSRRTLLRRAVTGGAVVTIGTAVVPLAGLFRPAAAQTKDTVLTEPELAGFAQAVELAAATAYDQGTGRLGPALQQAVAGFGGHHREHAARFAVVAGDKANPTPNPRLLQLLSDQLRDAPDDKAAAKLLLDLENSLAGTHLYALGISTAAPTLQLTASVLPVESAHAGRIAVALGLPASKAVPSFETEDNRLDPAAYTKTGTAK